MKQRLFILLIVVPFFLFSQNFCDFKNIKGHQPCIIVVLGHPGAGKGTFAQSIVDQGFVHISLGDFLRSEYRNKTDIGLRWKNEVETYGILAIEVVQEVTRALMEKIANDPPQVYILDGHVRLLEQAKDLDCLLEKFTNIYPLFLYINTDKEIALKRIPSRRTCSQCSYIYNLDSHPPIKQGQCNFCGSELAHRETDNLINGKNRIDTYAPHLEQTVYYYKDKGLLVELDGNLPLEQCINLYRELFCGQ